MAVSEIHWNGPKRRPGLFEQYLEGKQKLMKRRTKRTRLSQNRYSYNALYFIAKIKK